MDNNNDLTISNDSERSFGEVEARETDETTDNQSEDEEQTFSSQETELESQETDSEESSSNEESEENVEYTEKGTKKDPNPQSAIHQELANERRLRMQMEQVLGNPQLLNQYMEQQFGIKAPQFQTEQQTTEPKATRYKAEEFKSVEDIVDKLNEVNETFDSKLKSYEQENQQLKQAVIGILQEGQQSKFVSSLTQEANALKGEKELDPKSPEYIEGLEGDIVLAYQQFNTDPQTGQFVPRVTLSQVGKQVIEAARKARAKGSMQAQTVVKDKSEGRVRTGNQVQTEPDTDSMSASDSIAARIRRMAKRVAF